MLEKAKLERVLFIDIETTSQKHKFVELTERQQELFLKSFKNKGADACVTEEDKSNLYDRLAPIFASDWGKIITISVGKLIVAGDKKYTIKMVSFADRDEKILLQKFISKLDVYLNDTSYVFCAHNGFVFDYPVIVKRLIVNGIKPPTILSFSDKKPWEIQHLDTKKEWSHGVFDNNTSLDVLTEIFGIDSPKDDIDGSQVKGVYYEDVQNGLERIKKYCEKDVIATIKVVLKMRCLEEEIVD